jgi:23S rRNA pseudouridine1911/1915/1917 synthase
MASAHSTAGEETLDRQVKAYLKGRYEKPGNVFLGVVHRLDRPVSGVLLFARTSKAAARLAQQFREGSVKKVYWAVLEGRLDIAHGTLSDWLWKDDRQGRVQVLARAAPQARRATLHFEQRGRSPELTWVEVRPQTGRTHQIRVQFAHRGHPIVGDAKYGSVQTFDGGIALHARALTFLHPIHHEPITLAAELPGTWRRFHSLGVHVPP